MQGHGESGEFTPGMQRLEELRRRHAPIPQEVCPTRDSPLWLWHRFGWGMMHQRIWPTAALNNAIIHYLSPRKWGDFLEDLVGVFPWLLLIMGEIALLAWCVQSTSVTPIWWLLMGELLLLPMIAGAWAQVMVLIHFRRVAARVPWEELATTRLDAPEIMVGLTLRPILLQVAASVVFTLPLIFLLGAFYYFYFTRNTLFLTGFCELFAFTLLTIYRTFVLKTSVEFAAIVAIRCCLLIRDPLMAMVRALRDWFFPWALIPILLPAVVAASILIQTQTVIFFYLAIFVPLIALWLLFVIPGMLRSFADEIMFWVVHHRADWVVYSGQDSGKAPGNLFAPWKLTKSLRK